MNDKRFIACDKWADSEGNIFKFVVIDTKKLGDKQFILRCNHWSQAQDICNRLNDTLDELREENEQLREELSECEKFRYSVFKRIEKTIEDKDNCVLNKDAKSPCKDYDECLKRQSTNKPLPCVVNWMMGRPFENMKKEANR